MHGTSVGLFKTGRSMECTSVFHVSFNVHVVLHVRYVYVRLCLPFGNIRHLRACYQTVTFGLKGLKCLCFPP